MGQSGFESVFDDAMFNKLVLEVYEYVKKGALSKTNVAQMSFKLREKLDENGELMFYDMRVKGEKKGIKQDTMIARLNRIIHNWKRYLAPLMEPLLLEATYQHALKAKDSPASYRTVATIIARPGSDVDESKPALPPSVAAILQQNPVGTTIIIGQDRVAQGTGEAGYERADTGDNVADGQRQGTPVEAIPPGDDKPVHGVHEGGDTPERPLVPDTALAFEDPVDNNGWADMGTPE